MVEMTHKKPWALLLLFFLPFLLARDAQLESNIDYMAVITSPESPFRTSPDANAAPVAVLHEGIKIQILDKIEIKSQPSGRDEVGPKRRNPVEREA